MKINPQPNIIIKNIKRVRGENNQKTSNVEQLMNIYYYFFFHTILNKL
jgi:hypothetical protein